jgi:hypothetical protein
MNANNNQTPKANDQPLSELTFSEAPASWNTRYIDPNGFECQITLRGENGSELLEKAANAIAYLLKYGCAPYTFRPDTRQTESTAGGSPGNDDASSWLDLGQQPAIGSQSIFQRRWEGMLGGQAVLEQEQPDTRISHQFRDQRPLIRA